MPVSLAVTRFTGLRPAGTVPDPETARELGRIERLLAQPGNAASAVRSLRGLVTFDLELKRAWELGVRAFDGVRYDYQPPMQVRRALADGRAALDQGDRQAALRIARQLVSVDPELKQGWELGLAAFD